ncbi:MAG: biotin--[acetyl-CoA-carboxylase] ligase, partial [Novosphingobium sp.]
EGTFAGLAADGALQLRLADGSLRAIHAGEINLSNRS